MLSRRVHFSIESGDFDSGFGVSLHYFDHHHRLIELDQGQLPANPTLLNCYQKWKALYLRWGTCFRLEPISDEPVNVSFLEFVQRAATALEQEMNQWLASNDFAPLRTTLYQHLSSPQSTILFLQTQNLLLQRLPWSCWTLFDEFPWAQFAVAPTCYGATALIYPKDPIPHINLLAVLTGGEEVDTQGDRQLLETLSQTYLKVVRSPTRREMTDSLWKKRWDILFFAGHSSSETGEGRFIIAQDQWMFPSDMKFAIQKAAKQGLKLAIFNSCDGLAIAQDLVRNDVPFIITMREPVPDAVAQAFLAYFLQAYSTTGQSLFQAFQQAQKRLESLEDRYPCATWLPVLVCNPLVSPPDWTQLLGESKHPASIVPKRRQPQFNILIFFSLLLILLLGRSLGVMQEMELWAFDQLMQQRPTEASDSRLLIVELDETSIQTKPQKIGSIADSDLNQALQILDRHRPRVIGLDIYRDHKLDPSLEETLRNAKTIVGICKSPDIIYDRTGVAAPTGLSQDRLGFSDVLRDHDRVVRRQILFMKSSPTKVCATNWSFSSVLALRYLAQEKVTHHFSTAKREQDQRMVLGETILPSIRLPWGGYQTLDSAGHQMMLNYRATRSLRQIAEIVQLEDVLQDQVPDETIRDRIVMIGVTANTSADLWETPYRSDGTGTLPGVFLQAHMVSQLISAVQDSRPLIHTWPNWLEVMWITLWGMIGLGLPRSLRWVRLTGLAVGTLTLIFLSFLGILGGLWLPLIPSLIFLCGMGLYPRKGLNFKTLFLRLHS